MDRWVGFFATDDEAGDFGGVSVVFGEELVDAGARAYFTAGGEWCSGEKVAGLGAVDVALECLGVVEAVDEDELVAEWGERGQDLAEFHLLALTFGPPFAGVESVAGEEHGEAGGGFTGMGVGCGEVIAPDMGGFEPGQRHGDAEAAEEVSAGEVVLHGDQGVGWVD
ncbi:MAG: hypothetical protein RI897_905 [Verrucomicrobiota bacterium]